MSDVAFFMIHGSALNFHWNIQNMSFDLYTWEIEWNCYNPFAPGDGNVSIVYELVRLHRLCIKKMLRDANI